MTVNHHRQLTEAGRRGELGRLRSLLAAGANANARDQYGSTPLHSAASWGDREIASLLLDHGADVHARGWEGWTPMHTAAAMGGPGVIGLLLDRGAEIEARDDAGWTPLHLAARLGRAEVASFLLDRGADPHARNADGHTPLEVALGNERLQNHQGQLWRVLGEAASRDAANHSRRSSLLPPPGWSAAEHGQQMPGTEQSKEVQVAEEEKKLSWVQRILLERMKPNDGNGQNQRGRGRSLPDEQKEQDNDLGM